MWQYKILDRKQNNYLKIRLLQSNNLQISTYWPLKLSVSSLQIQVILLFQFFHESDYTWLPFKSFQ